MSSHKPTTFKAKKKASGDMALQITSMADIFTIILVFLLKSFASGAMNIEPSAGIKIPAAKSEPAEIQALVVEVSSDAIQVDHAPVATLKEYHFGPGDLNATGVSSALEEAFDLQRKKQDLIAKSNSEVQQDAKMILIADERVPYVTIKAVLASAAVHGFSDFRLAVLQQEHM
jgi:biopolymer transport protein ExbD